MYKFKRLSYDASYKELARAQEENTSDIRGELDCAFLTNRTKIWERFEGQWDQVTQRIGSLCKYDAEGKGCWHFQVQKQIDLCWKAELEPVNTGGLAFPYRVAESQELAKNTYESSSVEIYRRERSISKIKC